MEGFKNRVRLPMQLHSAQFPEERSTFRKANGEVKTMSVVIRKQYELETDFFPEKWHQRLKIALAHDSVSWEGERYFGDVAQDGDYTIEWPEGALHYPTAKAACKVQVTPFDATNSNCQSCQEATQLNLQDDQATGIYGDLQENHSYSVNTADNDSICCYPAVFSLVSFNSDYLSSASIDPNTGILSIHTKTGLASINSLVIARYRVTCPNGSYDEADVIANIDGSLPADCLAPTGLLINSISSSGAHAQWTEPVPGSTYYWELYKNSGPIGSPVQTGTVTDDEMTLTGLDADSEYYFRVRRVCDVYSNSNYVATTFDTSVAVVSCGSYRLTNTGDQPFTVAVYKDCEGNNSTPQYIFYQNSLIVCALENSPGDPVLISASPNVTIEYLGSC